MSDTAGQTPAPRASRGALWSAADLWTQQISQLLTFILVGNLLGPGTVGLMTMAVVTTLFLATFLENGFTDTLIQKDELRQEHIDSALWLMIAIGTVEALILWLVSPLIANFFSEPQLKQILPLMAIGLPFIGVTACYGAVLQRQLKFKQLATRSIFAYTSGFLAAYALARTGHGVYSLVASFLVARILDAVLVVAIGGFRPRFVITKSALDDVVDFGKHRVAHQAVNYVHSQLDRIVIGYFLGPHALGLYAVAERLVSALIAGVSGVLHRVAFPVLSAHQKDRASFDIAMRDFLTAANLISFPLFAGLALTSDSLIHIMFTADWTGVVPLMMIFCLLGFIHPTNYVLTAATNALGRPQLVLRISLVIFFMRIFVGPLAAQFGVHWVVVGNVAVYAAGLPIFMFLLRELFGKSWGYYFGDSARPALATLAMAVVVWTLERTVHGLNVWETLALDVTVGVASYVAALRVLAPALFGRAVGLVMNRA